MILAALTNGKSQQPAVLQLLPFSRNDAATSHTHRTTQLTTLSRAQVSHYMPDNDTEALSVLGVARTADNSYELRLKSGSHNVFEDDRGFPKGKHHCLLRTLSKRLSCCESRPKTSENNKGSSSVRAPVKSQYRVTPGHSNIPEAKSDIKVAESRWPASNTTRFWEFSSKSHGETVLVKKSQGKINLDICLNAQISSSKYVRSMKLNVNELPRSKTPITENDPDKLNMKRVIAFLQTSAPNNGLLSDDDNDDNVDYEETRNESQADSYKSFTRQITSNTPVPLKVTKNCVISGRHNTTKSNRVGSNACEHQVNHEIKTPFRHSNSNPMSDSYHNGDSEKTYKKNESPKIDLKRDFETKLEYFHSSYEDICTAENILKLPDSNDQSRPFGLDRFMTCVPKCSETLLSSAESITVHNQIPKSHSVSSEPFRNVGKSGEYRKHSLLSKRNQTRQSMHLSSNYGIHYVQNDMAFNISRTCADKRRLQAQLARVGTPDKSKQLEVDNIICVPGAHFEADSDEENTPFSTMPNIRNKTAMTQ